MIGKNKNKTSPVGQSKYTKYMKYISARNIVLINVLMHYIVLI
jgi:hypothetical protein